MTMPVLHTTADSGLTFVSKSDGVAATSITVDKPTDVLPGEHLLLLFQSLSSVTLNLDVNSQTDLSGFIEITNNTGGGYTDRCYTWAAIKKVNADEQATYTVNFPSNTGDAFLHAIRITNLDTTLPIIASQGQSSASMTTGTVPYYDTVEDDVLEISFIGAIRANTMTQNGAPDGMTSVFRKITRSNTSGLASALAVRERPLRTRCEAQVWPTFVTTASRGGVYTIYLRGKRSLGNRYFFGYYPRSNAGYSTLGAGATEYTYSYGDLSSLNPLLPTSHVVGPNQKIVAAYMNGAPVTSGTPGTNKIGLYSANASTGKIEGQMDVWDHPVMPHNQYVPVWAGLDITRYLLRDENTVLKPVGGLGGNSGAGRGGKIATFPVTSGISKRLTGSFEDPYGDPADNTSLVPMYFVVEDIAEPTLVEVNDGSDTIKYGSRASMRAINFTGNITSASVNTLKAVAFDNTGFTPLPLITGLRVPAPGAVTATVTSATESSSLSVQMTAPEDYEIIRLAGTLNTSANSIIYNFNPPAKVGDWIAYPTKQLVDGVMTNTNTTVLPDGSFETTINGAQLCFHLEDLLDGFANVRTFPLITGQVASAPIITNVNNGSIVLGSGTGTLTVANFGALTGVTIGGVAVTGLTGSGNDYTFNIPNLTAGQNVPRFGTVEVTATDGTNTKSTLVNVFPPSNYSVYTLINTSTDAGTIGALTTTAVDDQIVMRTASSLSIALNDIDMNGGQIQTNNSSSQTAFRRNKTNGALTSVTIPAADGNTPDIVPDAFTITPIPNAPLNTVVTFDPFVINGMTPGSDSPISITGGTWAVYRNDEWTAPSAGTGNVRNGEMIRVSTTSSSSNSTQVTGTVTIGGVSAPFSVTTVMPDAIIEVTGSTKPGVTKNWSALYFDPVVNYAELDGVPCSNVGANSFTPPAYNQGQATARPGTRVLFATDGTRSDVADVDVGVPDGYTYVELIEQSDSEDRVTPDEAEAGDFLVYQNSTGASILNTGLPESTEHVTIDAWLIKNKIATQHELVLNVPDVVPIPTTSVRPLKAATQFNIVNNVTLTIADPWRGMIGRTPHRIGGGDVTHLVLIFDAWYLAAASTGSATALTNDYFIHSATIEWNGIAVPMTFAGSTTRNVAAGESHVLTDELNVQAAFGQPYIPYDAEIFVKYRISVPAFGNILPMSTYRTSAMIPGTQYFRYNETSVIGADTAPGAWTTTNTMSITTAYTPMVVGRHVQEDAVAVFAHGDSITAGASDAGASPTGHAWLGRALGLFAKKPGFFNFGVSGSMIHAGNTDPRLVPFYGYCNVGFTGAGTNDFNFNGTSVSVATALSRQAAVIGRMKNNGIRKVGIMCLLPRTNSSDSWATLENQTFNGWSPGANPDIYNQTIRSGGYDGVILHDAVRASADPYKWIVDGTANKYTTDGIHPRQVSYAMLAADAKPIVESVIADSLVPVAYTSAASGDWNNTATWSPAGVPTSLDSVTINAGHTITVPSIFVAKHKGLNMVGAEDNEAVLNILGKVECHGNITGNQYSEITGTVVMNGFVNTIIGNTGKEIKAIVKTIVKTILGKIIH